jgi:hypothetical protein
MEAVESVKKSKFRKYRSGMTFLPCFIKTFQLVQKLFGRTYVLS